MTGEGPLFLPRQFLPQLGLQPSESREVADSFLRPLEREKFQVQSVLVLEQSIDRL